MFSENHYKILQVLSDGLPSPTQQFSDLTSQQIADATGISQPWVLHLLDELCEGQFIARHPMYSRSRSGEFLIQLKSKGQAAVESPNHFLGKPMTNDKSYNWYGDRVAGDKFTGDKVMGNKVQIGTVQGDAIAGNKVIHSQNLAQAAQDIKALLDQLAADYDTTKPSGKMKLSTRILEALESDVSMKKRFLNALKEGGTTALEEAIDHPLAKPVVAALKGFIEAEE